MSSKRVHLQMEINGDTRAVLPFTLLSHLGPRLRVARCTTCVSTFCGTVRRLPALQYDMILRPKRSVLNHYSPNWILLCSAAKPRLLNHWIRLVAKRLNCLSLPPGIQRLVAQCSAQKLRLLHTSSCRGATNLGKRYFALPSRFRLDGGVNLELAQVPKLRNEPTLCTSGGWWVQLVELSQLM